MKKAGIVLTLGLAAAIGSAVPFSAMAADETKDVTISTNQTSQSAQSTVELNKTEEAVPVYTVSVPATIELGRDAVKVPITLSLQDDTSLVPMDKKVSVKIASAGYAGNLTKFAVWNSRKLKEANYQLIDTPRAASPHVYAIGDTVAEWKYGNHGTQTRYAQLTDNYDSIPAGKYTGVINSTIAYEDKQSFTHNYS